MDDAGAPDSSCIVDREQGGIGQENGAAAMQEERSGGEPATDVPELPEIVLTKALWRQIRSLQETEKEVQERLERQRVQQLVDKVEDEVEYEGILDDVCSRIRAEEEAMEVERREREWELERREEELEEQVEVLKDRVKRLEEELRMAQLESTPADVMQKMLYEGDGNQALMIENVVPKDIEVLDGGGGGDGDGGDKPLPNPTHDILVAFEDMLKEADERHDREKKAMEDTILEKEKTERKFRHERYEWRARLKQMESQMLAMEKEIGRASGLLKERDSVVAMEKERRLAAEEAAAKFSSLLKDERLAHKFATVKLKKVESFFNKLKDRIAREKAGNASSAFLTELEKEVGRLSSIFSVKKDLHKAMEGEQFEALKKQRDAAVAERDKLEEKLNRLLKRSRDREAEIDAMWLEREKLLIEKVTSLEERTERYEEDIASEKRSRRQNAGEHRKDWDNEKSALEEAVRDRENALKAQREETQRLIEEKDRELHTLKTVHQQLLRDLALYKKHTKQDLEERTDSSQDTRPEQSVDQSGDTMAVDLERHSEGASNRSDSVGTEKASSERSELEEKVIDTLSLVEELKSKMNEKESQMQWERKQMETIVTNRTAEAESLRRQLESKELEMETRVDKFRSEMQLMERELEKERLERESVLASKGKLVAEVQKRVNEMVQELSSLRLELRKKTEELDCLKREKRMEEARISKVLVVQKELEDEVSRLQHENAELSFAVAAPENGMDSERTGDTSSSSGDKRHEEWQFALEKVAVFDKQISEAMLAIQNLREELCVKEAELQKARSEPELELERREEAWTQERERQEAMYAQKVETWRRTEQKILAEKTELLKVLETERSESSDAIALLNGTIRELQWTLMRKAPGESVDHLFKSTPKGEMVKVHASHLNEVDQYIYELKGKVVELERSKVKKPTREEELDEALLHVEKEMLSVSPDRRSRLIKYGSPPSVRPRAVERSLTSLMLQPGTSSDRSWNPLSCVSRDNTIEDRWTHELPAPEALSLAVPPRQQKKWIVDTSWLDQVRKEHSFLTQQLALERQRLAALGQVEAENHWMEAMMLRALEQKKECEHKLSQLQDKISPWSQKRVALTMLRSVDQRRLARRFVVPRLHSFHSFSFLHQNAPAGEAATPSFAPDHALQDRKAAAFRGLGPFGVVQGLAEEKFQASAGAKSRFLSSSTRFPCAPSRSSAVQVDEDEPEEKPAKHDPSPEECDQAVEGLSSAKAKALTKEAPKKVSVVTRVWNALIGIGPALRAIASMSRADWAVKIKGWSKSLKETLQHYWLGTKLLWVDVRISSRLLLKLLRGQTLSRRERKQLTRTAADIFRLVPFAVFIIVPFMEFLLPVFLKVFPNMLPSTFQDKMKEQEKLKKRLNARMEYARFLQETVEEMAKEVKTKSNSSDVQRTAEDLTEFLVKVRTGRRVSNEDILAFAKFFNDELTLDNISRPRLLNMCKYMGIQAYGTDAYLRYSLRQKLARIKADDIMIQTEGIDSLSEPELVSACRERGILEITSVDELKQQLRNWLDLSLNHALPSSLLILSRAFLSGNLKLEEAVQATLLSLPDEVVESVGVTVLPSEDALEERLRKIEYLQSQEEFIKEEAEDEEEELERRRKQEAAEQVDKALSEMKVSTAQEAVELAREKRKEQQDRLCKLSSALAVLASASSVSKERGEFLRLVNKEIGIYNSMLEDTGAEEAKKAYQAARMKDKEEDKDDASAGTKISQALISKVDRMLHKLEKEIDAVDAEIGDKWRILDRDSDGKVTAEEVAAAAMFLKDTLGHEPVQELVSKLAKDPEGKILVEDIVKLGTTADSEVLADELNESAKKKKQKQQQEQQQQQQQKS
ncbi:plectin [Selaginella moellendorffii]|uniref:plectin n=1 Tax=Selaginella moellendorffii TaxID=88036 RepID=UPI000D1C910D|nr:plectin [Selaginella moellendorffii]|eukprot:XP_024517041.1 plectin [Selaginella moellendorffii]